VVLALALAGCQAARPSALARGTARPAGEARHEGSSIFTDVARPAGLAFRYGYGGRSPLDLLEISGGGAGLLDVDGDGWLDVLLVGQQRCALYRNDHDGTFTDVTRRAGLTAEGTWMGCAAGDIDDDGRVDLFLCGYRCAALFRNRGDGSFVDVSRTAGIRPGGWMSSAAFADVDRDGRLDLYVGRYARWDTSTLRFCVVEGVRTACGPEMYDPEKGSFYHNEGGGRGGGPVRFVEATPRFGLGDTHGKTWGVAFADMNDDGWPDLYLANDEVPCDLYENVRGARFRNVGLASGTAFSRDGVRQGGMGVDWGDYDNDGRLDLFVTTFYQQPKSLYHNDGGGRFSEVSDVAGIAAPTLPYVAFGTCFLDVDNDGLLDLFIANGHVRDNPERLDPAVHYAQPMQLFRNDGSGVFRDLSREAGPAFDRPIVGRAAASGDIDNDGDIDLLVVDAAGAPLLLRNESGNRRHWLTVRALTAQRRDAIGARITITAGGRRQVAEVRPGASFLATNDPRVHFGLGEADRVERLQIRWPDGRVEERRDLSANQFMTLVEARRGRAAPAETRRKRV
jgi:enediyne biosynthesis protein E4